MSSHSTLYVGDNTHVLELVDLQDNEGAVQTDATVQLTALVDAQTGAAVTGVTLPLSMPHVSGGLYRAILPHGLSVRAGHIYSATIKALGTQSFRAEWVERLLAQERAA
jgi:hypothetical protein